MRERERETGHCPLIGRALKNFKRARLLCIYVHAALYGVRELLSSAFLFIAGRKSGQANGRGRLSPAREPVSLLGPRQGMLFLRTVAVALYPSMGRRNSFARDAEKSARVRG